MEIAQTADYALLALLALEETAHQTATELSQSLGLNRTVTQRTLSTLHARGFVLRNLDGRYSLGPALISTAAALPHEIVAPSSKPLKDLALASQETTIVAVPDGDEAVIVASGAGSSGPLRVEFEAGFRQPIWRGASGLAILAHMPEDPAVQELGQDERAIIEQSLRLGYARTQGHIRADTAGIAAPLLDPTGKPLGSVAIVVPSLRADRLSVLAPALLATARLIEAEHCASEEALEARAERG